MTANHSKFYLPYPNKLVDQYNNTYDHSINKKPINDDCSVSTEEIETNHQASKFKVKDGLRITKYKKVFSRNPTGTSQEKYLWSILFWKLIFGLIKLKI